MFYWYETYESYQPNYYVSSRTLVYSIFRMN